jgi:hypothetical protein
MGAGNLQLNQDETDNSSENTSTDLREVNNKQISLQHPY